MILLVDNYDSFVHNLARYFQQLGHTTRIVRNDAIRAEAIQADRPAAVVLSPGPNVVVAIFVMLFHGMLVLKPSFESSPELPELT